MPLDSDQMTQERVTESLPAASLSYKTTPHDVAAVPAPSAEAERLAVLRRYHILDTPPERDFDDLAVTAARICDTPMAVVSLVDADRQWFKAKVGWGAAESARANPLCASTL